MSNPEIQPALDAIGFVPDATATKDDITRNEATEGVGFSIFPNPSADKTMVVIDLQKTEMVSLDITDITGRVIKTVFQHKSLPEGKNQISVETKDLTAGFYVFILRGTSKELGFVRFVKI